MKAKNIRRRFESAPVGALQFKTWLDEEATKLGTTRHALYMRIKRGRHPKPKMFRGGRSRAEFVIP